ncbi:MAG: nucleotidyltransferase domain-containing protein [Nanoarchaeota archaeon]
MAEEKHQNSEKPKRQENLSDELKNPGMNYQPGQKLPGEITEEAKKEIDKTKQKLDEFKKEIIKKYPFTLALGITPPQAAERFDEELGLTEEEKKTKPMHIVMVIPEDNYKDIAKIKAEIIKIVKDNKPRLWVNIITPVDLWNFCLDSKYDIVEALGMSYPLHDKGILGALRVSQIHKSLCLRKFEKYIYSYVIGGSLVRGEAKQTSDVDIFVIIDDTDVKRMSRLELKEKLRGIIYQYVAEAGELAGVKNKLSPQVYLLTEFWEDVKDASPVIFTFIRDGIPLYDRGGFLPWKLLLKMGKIKPSPEAIDRFMSMGDKSKDIIKQRLLDIVINDIYWSILTPSQALLMMYGIPPTTPKETVSEVKRIFVEKEKIMEKKYFDILENIVINYYKGFEHGKVKEVSGTEIDKLIKDFDDYTKKLKEMAVEIEKRSQERIIEDTYANVFKLLRHLFGNKNEGELVKDFERELIKKGRSDPKNLHIINHLIDAKKRYKSKKKPSKYEIEDIRKNANVLINNLIEFGQRCDMSEIRKMQVRINYKENGKDKHAEVFLTNPIYVIIDNQFKKIVEKDEKARFEEGKQDEFDSILSTQKGKPNKLSEKVLELLRKELRDFSIDL